MQSYRSGDLEGEQATIDNIIEGLETLSLMSERKVVLLPDFAPAAGKEMKGFSQADIKTLTEYLADIPEGSMLIMTPQIRRRKGKERKSADGRRKIRKVYDFQPLRDGQLRSFIEKRFRSAGKSFSNSVVALIMSESGYGNKAVDYGLYNLENDLRKIIAHSGKAVEITVDDVGDHFCEP